MIEFITAIGALGTAAFGLVDATKAFGGGVNHIGFSRIKAAVTALVPASDPDILPILQANWFSGTDLAAQKALAKSLIELNLTATHSDLILNALIDEAYQRADQLYRDGTRAWAMAIAITLALIAGHQFHTPISASLLAGLLATPLAPIAKDLSTALQTTAH